jgi:hypothetical protein
MISNECCENQFRGLSAEAASEIGCGEEVALVLVILKGGKVLHFRPHGDDFQIENIKTCFEKVTEPHIRENGEKPLLEVTVKVPRLEGFEDIDCPPKEYNSCITTLAYSCAGRPRCW